MLHMLKAYYLDLSASWVKMLPLIEFAHNNSHHATIKIVPYEALYGRRFHSPLIRQRCFSSVSWIKVNLENDLGCSVNHIKDKTSPRSIKKLYQS